MDPLSIASGVAGLLTLAGGILRFIKKHYTSASEAPHTVLQLRDAIELFATVLQSWEDESPAMGHAALQSNTALSSVVDQCRAELERLQSQLTSESALKIRTRLRWPFKERDAQDVVKNVKRYIAVFQFALDMAGW